MYTHILNRGAVLSKLEEQAAVTTNSSPGHYGVESCRQYVADDKGQPKHFDTVLGYHMVNKVRSMGSITGIHINIFQFTWYIKRGQEIVRGKAITFPFFRTVPRRFEPKDLIFRDEMIRSGDVMAPKYPVPGRNHICCVLTSNLTKVSPKEFKPRKGKDGRDYYDVHYNLVITTEGATMKFALSMNGKEMGSVQAKYE